MTDVERICSLNTIQEFFKVDPTKPLKEGTKALLEAMEEVSFKTRENIVTLGESGETGMYIILEGKTEVLNKEGNLINELSKGDFIGELALINEDGRSATVRATEAVICAHISKALFNSIAGNNPKIYATFMNMLYARTTKLVAEQERMKSELEIANRIQDSILVHDFSNFCELPSMKITAKMKPAKAVGGDFYDVFMIDESQMCFLIADVSGKGVPGAMFMTMAKTHIKNYAALGLPLERVAYLVNERLNENNEAQMFVTAFLGILNLETNIVTYVNAGHNPPFIAHKGNPFSMLKCKANLVLGMMDSINYMEQILELMPGDCFYLYTDGVTEAMNPQGDFYEEDRLLEALNRNQEVNNVQQFVNAIFNEIDDFVDGAQPSDDITMLYIDRRQYE